MCLGKECVELEEMCGVRCFESIVLGKERWGKGMREMLRKVDHDKMLGEGTVNSKGRGGCGVEMTLGGTSRHLH